MADRPEEITIAGAGLVGSLLALMLGQLGYRVVVYEKRADMRSMQVDSGRSINLALAERGIHALDKAGLMDEVAKLLILMKGRMLHDSIGNLEFFPYGQRPEEVIYSVSRSGLNELMMSAAENSQQVEIRFQQELQHIDFENQQIQFVDHLNGGEPYDVNYQMLIGADGAGSRVRRALLPAVSGNDRSELLDHDYKELTIPQGAGGQHQIEREALHIWPRGGYMLIALPNLDGSFTVTLFLQKTGSPSFASLQTKSDVEKFFETEFPDACELIPDLATEFFENPTGILGTVRCSPWIVDESVLLIGDASHAIVPFHGQGMNSGFEDCELFIEQLQHQDHDWTGVLRDFDRTRKDDADAIADLALQNYITMRDSVRDPKFQLKKEIGFELERRRPMKFIPQYSMVMFHRIPYSEVSRRGKIQDQLLNELAEECDQIEQVDFELADSLVDQRLNLLDGSALNLSH